MDILSKYKMPLLGTIAMSPKSEEKVKAEPEKYKYCFRVCLNGPGLGKYLVQTLASLKKEFGFTKLFIMHQDVLWAKATADVYRKSLGREGRLGDPWHRGLSHRIVGFLRGPH